MCPKYSQILDDGSGGFRGSSIVPLLYVIIVQTDGQRDDMDG